jgi:hypothetical protein
MLTPTFQNFIKREIEAFNNALDLLNTNIQDYPNDDPRTAASRLVLHAREEHLKFLKNMQQEALTYNQAMDIVRRRLARIEAAHQEAADHDITFNQIHSKQWWDTLHQIEYLGEFIQRIHAWQGAARR